MSTPVIQFKRGLFQNLPALKTGEPGFTTDKYDLYVGFNSTTEYNKFIGSHRYWTRETASTGSGVNLVENTSGSDYITLRAPSSVGTAVTYTFPGVQGSIHSILTNDSTGTLSWVTSPTFTGVTTFSNTTDNTLGDENTGAVQLDGGLGIAKNLTVKQNLHVGGYAEFVGVVTFKGGTINIGDGNTDDINVGGEFISGLVPNVDNTHDLGITTQRWRNLNVVSVATTNISITGLSTFTGAIDANGGADISGGETTLSSATISDLTAGRVVLAGTSGSIVDSANLTFSAGGLIVGAGGINITGISTFSTDLVVTGDLQVNGGDVTSTTASLNLFNANVTTANVLGAGTALIIGDTTGITTVRNNLTVGGDLRINGNDIQASDGNNNITLTSNTLTAFAGDIKIGGNDIQASDGTTAITLSATTGNVGIASNLIITGNLFVNGSTTEVNTETLKVEDSLIEIGLINSGGTLVAPTSDLNKDIGVIFHYFNSVARKAGIYWDDSEGRVAIGSTLSETTSVITATAYAALEIGSLFVTDCAGTSQVISCTGTERFLENITVDCGSF